MTAIPRCPEDLRGLALHRQEGEMRIGLGTRQLKDVEVEDERRR
jgi:hypothetical protein